MKYLKIAFGLAVMAGLMAISAAPSMAASPRWVQCKKVGTTEGRWKNNLCNERGGTEEWATREITETEEVTSSTKPGEFLTLEDRKAAGALSSIKCKGTDAGWIGSNGFDGIFNITATACEVVAGPCEAPVTAVPVNLPWDTELRKEPSGEIRDRVQAGGAGPGYEVKCTVGGIFKTTDTCTGEFSTGARNNQANGTVEAVFDTITEEKPQECSASTETGKKTGFAKGIDVNKQRSGNATKVQ